MLTTNYLIINREPFAFDTMKVESDCALFVDKDGKDLNVGPIALGKSVYAALFCDDVRNVTLVDDSNGVQAVETILWVSEDGYRAGKKLIEDALAVRMSRQNKKLNRYGEEIAKKLSIGINIQVIDAVEESAMVTCPDCGMQSPKGTPYCMDCGAELPLE